MSLDRDRLDRAGEVVSRNFDPPFDLANDLLCFLDTSRDIEQVLAGAVDLEDVAAIVGVGGLANQLRLGATGGVLVALNAALRFARFARRKASLRNDSCSRAG